MDIDYKRLKALFEEKVQEHIEFLKLESEKCKLQELSENGFVLDDFYSGFASALKTEVEMLENLLRHEALAMKKVKERGMRCNEQLI